MEITTGEEDEPVECLSCGWTGTESQLVDTLYYGEHDALPPQPEKACPRCESLGWEYED